MKHSNTLDRMFYVETAEEAVREYGYPEIIHANRGKQFLSRDFLKAFKDDNGKEISKASFRKKAIKTTFTLKGFEDLQI